jgi:hypothetical protein
MGRGQFQGVFLRDYSHTKKYEISNFKDVGTRQQKKRVTITEVHSCECTFGTQTNSDSKRSLCFN